MLLALGQVILSYNNRKVDTPNTKRKNTLSQALVRRWCGWYRDDAGNTTEENSSVLPNPNALVAIRNGT